MVRWRSSAVRFTWVPAVWIAEWHQQRCTNSPSLSGLRRRWRLEPELPSGRSAGLWLAESDETWCGEAQGRGLHQVGQHWNTVNRVSESEIRLAHLRVTGDAPTLPGKSEFYKTHTQLKLHLLDTAPLSWLTSHLCSCHETPYSWLKATEHSRCVFRYVSPWQTPHQSQVVFSTRNKMAAVISELQTGDVLIVTTEDRQQFTCAHLISEKTK